MHMQCMLEPGSLFKGQFRIGRWNVPRHGQMPARSNVLRFIRKEKEANNRAHDLILPQSKVESAIPEPLPLLG